MTQHTALDRSRPADRPTPFRSLRRFVTAGLLATLLAGAVGVVFPSAASAAIDIEKDDAGPNTDIDPVYQPAGFDYRLRSAYDWADSWRSDDDKSGKPWGWNTYDPNYVYPSKFLANFTTHVCLNKDEWQRQIDLLPTVNTYRWTYAGKTELTKECLKRKSVVLPTEGQFPVTLDVLDKAGTVLRTQTVNVFVKDYLIVVIGDSAASGEGSPDTELYKPDPTKGKVEWVDRRCHRSRRTATALAAQAFEASDPHSSVTYLSFACSGATIELNDPKSGVGLLAPYAGIEYTSGAYLPAQTQQLQDAINTLPQATAWKGPRKIDKLFISGGINDAQFGRLGGDCLLFTDCKNTDGVEGLLGNSSQTTVQWFSSSTQYVRSAYTHLRQDLDARGLNIGEALVTEYPNPLTSDNGSLCSAIMDDAIQAGKFVPILVTAVGLASPLVFATAAAVLGPVYGPLVAGLGPVAITLLVGYLIKTAVTSGWSSDEIAWLNSTAMPWLMDSVRAGAVNNGFTYVDTIAKAFQGHGYCATDNWIRRASEAVRTEGPYSSFWDGFLGAHVRSKGMLHPSPAGHVAMAELLRPHLDDLAKNQVVSAQDDRYKTDKDTPFVHALGGVSWNDTITSSAGYTVKLVTPPAGKLNIGTDGSFGYTPPTGFVGVDNFTYQLTDGAKTSSAKVRITVTDPNAKYEVAGGIFSYDSWTYETAGDKLPTVKAGGQVTIPLCTSCPQHGLTPIVVDQPAAGRVAIVNGMATYTANRDTKLAVDGFTVAVNIGGKLVGHARVEVVMA